MQLYRPLFNDMQLYRTLFNDMQLYRTVIPNTAVFGPTNFIETIGTARLKISAEDFAEDFYGGRTGPLEKCYLFIYFLLMISDEDFYGGRTGPLEKFYLFYFFF